VGREGFRGSIENSEGRPPVWETQPGARPPQESPLPAADEHTTLGPNASDASSLCQPPARVRHVSTQHELAASPRHRPRHGLEPPNTSSPPHHPTHVRLVIAQRELSRHVIACAMDYNHPTWVRHIDAQCELAHSPHHRLHHGLQPPNMSLPRHCPARAGCLTTSPDYNHPT
jgi:hypothetical protein